MSLTHQYPLGASGARHARMEYAGRARVTFLPVPAARAVPQVTAVLVVLVVQMVLVFLVALALQAAPVGPLANSTNETRAAP